MYILKGFIAFPTLTNNVVGEVAPVGEISKDSLTYAKETGLYKSLSYPNVLLHSFKSYSDTLGVLEVPVTHSDMALRVASTLMDLAIGGRLTTNRTLSLVTISQEFSTYFKEFNIGEMVVTDNGHWMPAWITYSLNDTPSYVKLWFSDKHFSAEYDGFEYEFVAPLENIDDFFRPEEQVKGLLAEQTVPRLIERIETIRGEHPYTTISTQNYTWNILDSTSDERVDTSWTVLIYGRAGKDPDQIRSALINWIIENSEHSREEWLAIFPDIFTPTEFTIMPLWHQFAIPNQTVQAGLNSPVISLGRALELAKIFCKGIGYNDNVLIENTVVVPSPYRDLAFLVTGSSVNRNGVSDFRELYPDYIGISSSSNDFGRLSTDTQNWINMFIELLAVAGEMTSYTFIPNKYGRVIRDGIIFTSREYDGYQYLMVTRDSALRELGIETPFGTQTDPILELDDCGIESILVREHLIYEVDPHDVTKEQVGLRNLTNVPLTTVGDILNNQDSTLVEFFAMISHIGNSKAHVPSVEQYNLDSVVNRSWMTLGEGLLEAKRIINDL